MTVTKYIYDGDTVLHETDGAGTPLRTYTHDPGRYGDLLSVYDGSAAKYFEPDALGSTDALADQSQTVVDRWRYRAFGSATQTVGTDANPFTWVGRLGYYADSETGLYQLGNGTRYYDPQTAQFLSDDPVGFLPGDANLYRYVANNALNYIDPSGLWEIQSVTITPSRLLQMNVAGMEAWFTITIKGKQLKELEYTQIIKNTTELWDDKGKPLTEEQVLKAVLRTSSPSKALMPNTAWQLDDNFHDKGRWLCMDKDSEKVIVDRHRMPSPVFGDPKARILAYYPMRRTAMMKLLFRPCGVSSVVPFPVGNAIIIEAKSWSFTFQNYSGAKPTAPLFVKNAPDKDVGFYAADGFTPPPLWDKRGK